MSIAAPSTTQPTAGSDPGVRPHAKVRGTELTEVRWIDGFWATWLRRCREVMVPTMLRLMEGTERTHFIQNLRIAAGEAEGRHRGAKWNDGDFYKCLEATASLHAIEPDAQLDATMDSLIDLIGRAQRADGYLHTPVLIDHRNGGSAKPFADPMHFEMYNMGHLIAAAVVHHRATGKENLLKIAIKSADFLDREFANPTPEQARHGICPSHLMALIDLYRLTLEPRYVRLAERLLNMRDLVTNGDDDNQDRVPLRQESRAVGHSVRGTYLWASAADVYTESGDPSLLAPLQRIWDDLVTKKLYITGGCGALYDGASPDGAVDQKVITRVHQAFGRDYQLPHSTAHNETCGAIGNVLWSWRMFQITGEAKYVDVVEQTLLNSVLAGVSLDGTRWFYTNTLRNLHPMPVELRWPRSRQEFIGCFCCPPNVVRTVAQLGRYAYATSRQGVWVTLFGGNRLSTTLPGGQRVELTQETDYPWHDQVRLTMGPATAGEFSLMLRIPGWCEAARIRVNGRQIDETPRAGTFHELRRPWSPGDVVELELPMPALFVEANPYVEEATNQVALVRGPIVYCLEGVDLPEGVRVTDVRVARDADLTVGPRDTKLDGVPEIRARGQAVAQGDWSGRLYRNVAAAPAAREIDLRFIPYFAWDNRGESEMTVWLAASR